MDRPLYARFNAVTMRAASWTGTPAIKGRTESTRMALLTFSLIGLQYVFFFPFVSG